MFFDSRERIALFLDGANLAASCHVLDLKIDFRRLLEVFGSRATLVRALYYTQILEGSSIHQLTDWLDYNGYTVITKAAKEYSDTSGQVRVRGSMDIELAVDALRIARHVDHVFLFTGNGEFTALVSELKNQGRRVSVVSTMRSDPPMVSGKLRRMADQFIDLGDIRAELSRECAKIS